MFFSLLKLSFRALKTNVMRTILTTLGIVVGISTVILVLSLGEGLRALIMKQLATFSPESLYIEIQVPARGGREAKNEASGTAIASGVQITTMKLRDVEDVKDLPNIVSAYGENMGQAKVTYRSVEKTVMFFAVQSSYTEVESNKVEAGRFWNSSEEKSLSRVVVLGHDLKNTLFGQQDAIGQMIKMNKINYRVIGVMEKLGSQMFMNLDDGLYVPLESAQKQLLGFNYITFMVAKMKDAKLTAVTVNNIERILRKNHDIKDPDKDDFAVRTMDEAMDIVNTVTGGISLLLISIAAISLLVGGVGIMNIMYVTVTERTKEIGLKKALGAPPLSIKTEFILEALIVTLWGGILGILWGVFVSWGVSQTAQLVGFDWPFVVSRDGLIWAFTVSSAIGLLFGYAPAHRAAQLNPIEALRSE